MQSVFHWLYWRWSRYRATRRSGVNKNDSNVQLRAECRIAEQLTHRYGYIHAMQMLNLNKQNRITRFEKCTRPKIDYDILMLRVWRAISTRMSIVQVCVEHYRVFVILFSPSCGTLSGPCTRQLEFISIHGKHHAYALRIHMPEHTSRACIRYKTHGPSLEPPAKKNVSQKICPMAISEATTNALDLAKIGVTKKSNRVDGNILPQIW